MEEMEERGLMTCNHVKTDLQRGTKFFVGQQVTRPQDVYKKSPLMHGVVVRVYRMEGCQHGPYPEMYDVRWDDAPCPQREYMGEYLPHGLRADSQPVPPKGDK